MAVRLASDPVGYVGPLRLLEAAMGSEELEMELKEERVEVDELEERHR